VEENPKIQILVDYLDSLDEATQEYVVELARRIFPAAVMPSGK